MCGRWVVHQQMISAASQQIEKARLCPPHLARNKVTQPGAKERLSQEGPTWAYLIDKPRDENYAKIGPTANRLFGQRNTGHVGHTNIADHHTQ